jgi:hypothetical protein
VREREGEKWSVRESEGERWSVRERERGRETECESKREGQRDGGIVRYHSEGTWAHRCALRYTVVQINGFRAGCAGRRKQDWMKRVDV